MTILDLQLLEMQVDALFTHDVDGRMRSVNEPQGEVAPRFFFGRTSAGNLWRFRHDLPPDTVRRLDELASAEPVDDLRAEPRNWPAILAALRQDQQIRWIESGPAYRFPDQLPPPDNVTRITRSDLHLLRPMVADVDEIAREFEKREPRVAVVQDGAAVSLCYSARLTERAAEAGVETLEAYRGRGYAGAAVAGWALAVRAMGRIPLYSTSWDNAASQAVARKLGLVQYATDLSVE